MGSIPREVIIFLIKFLAFNYIALFLVCNTAHFNVYIFLIVVLSSCSGKTRIRSNTEIG